MQIRVVKSDSGYVGLVVVPEGSPPLPPVAYQKVRVADVASVVESTIEDVKAARSTDPAPPG